MDYVITGFSHIYQKMWLKPFKTVFYTPLAKANGNFNYKNIRLGKVHITVSDYF